MLQITPLGHSCFQLSGDDLIIITDPFSSKIGDLPPDLKADIVTISHTQHEDHNAAGRISGDPKVFDWPGEYEVGGVQIRGLSTFHDDKQGTEKGENTVFVFRFSDATIAHLGDLGHPLDPEILDKMGQIDILLIPVSGPFIDTKKAKKIIDTIEPRIVIPMHFSDDKINLDILSPVTDFLKIMGQNGDTISEPTLKIKKSDLPIEGMEIHLLQAQ